MDEDPLELCRQGGNGKVIFCDVWNVWIDKALLTYYQRFKKNPKEMTRRLLKTLVGRRNLKNMCARGRTRNRDGIPRDIMNAIECKNIIENHVILFLTIYNILIYS